MNSKRNQSAPDNDRTRQSHVFGDQAPGSGEIPQAVRSWYWDASGENEIEECSWHTLFKKYANEDNSADKDNKD